MTSKATFFGIPSLRQFIPGISSDVATNEKKKCWANSYREPTGGHTGCGRAFVLLKKRAPRTAMKL